MFACYLFGIDRQVYYRKIKRKVSKQSKAIEVIAMVLESGNQCLGLVLKRVSCFIG